MKNTEKFLGVFAQSIKAAFPNGSISSTALEPWKYLLPLRLFLRFDGMIRLLHNQAQNFK